ncbi:hypothetical protein [Neisseria montereyensis]|nr:hypothetical protein [Neisseria montereyensis]
MYIRPFVWIRVMVGFLLGWLGFWRVWFWLVWLGSLARADI